MNLLNNDNINSVVSFPDRNDTIIHNLEFFNSSLRNDLEQNNAVFRWVLLLQNTHEFDLTNTTIKTSIAFPVQKENIRKETGFFNNRYDIIASLPTKKSFSVKAKIKKVSPYQPKPFI